MSAPTTSTGPGRLRIRSVVDHVYDDLRERILSGDIPRGTRLRQVSLAEELGVSRTPLREALRRLSAEGFVEFSRNQGATVSQLDLGDLRHAWTARLTLEPAAARLAAEHAAPRRSPACGRRWSGSARPATTARPASRPTVSSTWRSL